ncbi:hypothetical protein [Prevotella sp.]|uniref:hypothetical protein n=1 Tax=Prevotella sp. TaxID=59823 RepID=UPI0027E2D70F|nr:hypothetical protein [Prevotella sp.]
MNMNEYKEGDTIYILLTKSQAESVMGEWLENNWDCDLTVHRSQKTKGRVVLETMDLMFAARIIQWHTYERVTFKGKKVKK